MNIVIAMAGRGKRFQDAGYTVAKPLISVLNQPMYYWAARSLPLKAANKIIFVCLAEHLENYPLEIDIRKRFNQEVEIVSLKEVTQGQACSVLLAKNLINNSSPLMIYNADTYFESNLSELIQSQDQQIDGIISVFEAPGSQWSFAKINSDNEIIEIAEKKRISPWATTGMYYFRQGSDFVSAAEKMIAEKNTVNNEYYIGPVYNYLIAAGKRIIPDYCTHVDCLGTPEDLERFENKKRR